MFAVQNPQSGQHSGFAGYSQAEVITLPSHRRGEEKSASDTDTTTQPDSLRAMETVILSSVLTRNRHL